MKNLSPAIYVFLAIIVVGVALGSMFFANFFVQPKLCENQRVDLKPSESVRLQYSIIMDNIDGRFYRTDITSPIRVLSNQTINLCNAINPATFQCAEVLATIYTKQSFSKLPI